MISRSNQCEMIDRTSAAREFNIGGIRFRRATCSGIMIHPRPSMSVVVSDGVDKNSWHPPFFLRRCSQLSRLAEISFEFRATNHGCKYFPKSRKVAREIRARRTASFVDLRFLKSDKPYFAKSFVSSMHHRSPRRQTFSSRFLRDLD